MQEEVFAKDFKMAEDLANGKIDKPTNLTYIIFETGSAPIRNQFKINLPIAKKLFPWILIGISWNV